MAENFSGIQIPESEELLAFRGLLELSNKDFYQLAAQEAKIGGSRVLGYALLAEFLAVKNKEMADDLSTCKAILAISQSPISNGGRGQV